MFAVNVKNIYTMKRFCLIAMLVLFAGTAFVSCSDKDDFNPFEHQTTGEFNPGTITLRKSSDNLDVVEKWSNIVRNQQNKVVSYEYTRETKGDIKETESRKYTIDYYTDYLGNDVIRTNCIVDYCKNTEGIEEKYTQEVLENISLNKNGYIESISTTTDHYGNNNATPVTTTSLRTFKYQGDLCTGSTYLDRDKKITYTYNWNAYQLKNIKILKENLKSGTVEHNTYSYTFDTKAFYDYSGTEIMPFVQNGMPQILASMGYLGKCTPYILTGEIQEGYTKFADTTSDNPQIRNTYNFDVEPDNRIVYSGISNVYNNYSITFEK